MTVSSALCQPGTFSKDGLEQCTTCPIGTYQNLYGQVLCISCPRNTTTNNRGMRRQDMCRGMYSLTRLEITSWNV